MRLLICGSRKWNDGGLIGLIIDAIKPEVVIHGSAKGADSYADFWARFKKIEVEAYPAEWDRWGKTAGVIRNQKMLDEGKPDAVFAFGYGRGTDDMVQRAQAAGLLTYRVVMECDGQAATSSETERED